MINILAEAKAADLTGAYEWKTLKIGGGGWVTGLDISSAKNGPFYVRADVSGAYRWDASSSSWKQIVTPSSMPEGSLAYSKFGGVDSIVSAPKDPDIAYMAFAGEPHEEVAGQIYKSNNRGDTWTATNFRAHQVRMQPNGPGRQSGERLAVDPANSGVVYFGSPSNGLWVTQDGGDTWARVAAVPAGTPRQGVTTVVFDKGSGTTESKTNVLFVTVEQAGVFRSEDAGKTWVNIAESGPKSDGKPRDAEIGPDRTYYVAFDNAKGAVGSVWKYSSAGVWTDITPKDPKDGGSKAYWDVSIDPFDANHVVVMRNGGKCFVSKDQGATWSYHTFKLASPIVEWQGKQATYHLSVGELAFDPFEAGKLWFAEGFGVWWAKDLTTPQILWTSVSQGIEEACGNDVIAPPGGQPVAAMWDLGAFYFKDPDSYTAVKSHPGFTSAWALDWSPADPQFIAGIFRSHHDYVQPANTTGYSTDGGQTWKMFPAVEQKAIPAELEYGVIAVSANSTDKMVWAPTRKKLPYYTSDRGATWKQSSFGDVTATGLTGYPMPSKPLCADRVLSDTFYFFIPQNGVFRSTDGGAHFTKVGDLSPGGAGGWNGIMKSTIGHPGHLWFAEGINRGAWRSTDGGVTWSSLPGIKIAYNIGLGKPGQEGGYPTLFVAGLSDEDKNGVFRSTDEGKTWDQISGFPLGIPDYIDALDGDKDEFGKVYVAFSSAGFAYGMEKPGAPSGNPAAKAKEASQTKK